MQLQIIEVAIGVVAAFFIVSVIASALVESISIVFKKRSKDLRVVVDTILTTGSPGAINLEDTSVWKAMRAASRRKRGIAARDKRDPSYISARSFADGVVEGLLTLRTTAGSVANVVAGMPDGPLKQRLTTLQTEVGDDLVAVKASLEGWFDDTMDRLEGAYKRWSQWFLAIFGLLLALVLNVSTIRIVDSLWNDAVLRTAVADTSTGITSEPCPTNQVDCGPADKVDKAIRDLDSLSIPVGWGKDWSTESGAGWTLLGIIPTGFAVMMGGPFWFDLLTRLVGARGTRGVPPKAGEDPGSATVDVVEKGTARARQPLFSL
jgi:hypothetical protein